MGEIFPSYLSQVTLVATGVVVVVAVVVVVHIGRRRRPAMPLGSWHVARVDAAVLVLDAAEIDFASTGGAGVAN